MARDAWLQPVLFPLLGLLIGWTADLGGLPGDVPWNLRVFGAGTGLLGLLLVAWTLTVQVRAGNNPEMHQPTRTLVVHGPYLWSRNPVYLGFLVIQAGFGLYFGWWLTPVLVPATAWALTRFIIRREEAWLAAQFGEDYQTYCSKVRRWF